MFENVSRVTSLPRKLVTLIRMEPCRRRLALEAWWLVFRITMQHRVRPYRIWKQELAQTLAASSNAGTSGDSESLYRLLAAYRIGLRGQPLRPNCLQRSRALWRFLNRYGIASRVVIGTRLQEGQLQGHAWVEIDGKVLNDRQTVSTVYTPFAPRETENLELPFD